MRTYLLLIANLLSKLPVLPSQVRVSGTYGDIEPYNYENQNARFYLFSDGVFDSQEDIFFPIEGETMEDNTLDGIFQDKGFHQCEICETYTQTKNSDNIHICSDECVDEHLANLEEEQDIKDTQDTLDFIDGK